MNDNQKQIKKLEKQIKDMKDESKAYLCYKQAIITASKSKESPQAIIEGLKFVVKNIRSKSWKMVDRVAGASGNLSARGVCPVCNISLEGKNLRPKESSLPCGIGMFRSAEKQCSFEERQKI
jgi:DNA repair exonuclease SbcCD ATPase subunit